MSTTRDGKRYKSGMNLYSIVPNLGGPFVSEHRDTHLNGPGRWQTSGSPGGAGCIDQCYASERAAIEEIIRRYVAQIRELEAKNDKWAERLKKLRP